MPIALAAVAVVGLGVSVYQTVDAKKRQKEAEQAAQDYERQKLTNPYESLQVSRLGAELQQQNLNNQVATATDTLRSGGSRAILGGLPTIYDSVIQQNAQIAAGLDQQYNQNQQLAAQGNAMVQGMTEQRERDDLLGIGNAINTARQEYNQGLSNVVKSISNVANATSTMSKSGSNQDINSSPLAQSGSTGGLFSRGSDAVAINNSNFNTQPIVNMPRVSVNDPGYLDMLRQYNRTLYGR